MTFNIEELPYVVIVKILSCCSPEDIFTVLQAIPAFKNVFVHSSSLLQKCDLSNFYLWDKKHLEFVVNFIKNSKNIQKLNFNYLPREIARIAFNLHDIVKLSLFGYKLEIDELNVILSFPKLEDLSFDLINVKPYRTFCINPDPPSLATSFSIKRVHIFLPCYKPWNLDMFSWFLCSCRNVRHIFLSSALTSIPMTSIDRFLRMLSEEPQLFPQHRHITFGEENAANTSYFQEYHSVVSSSVNADPEIEDVFRFSPYKKECVPFMRYKSLLFASLDAVQAIKVRVTEIKEVILHSNGFGARGEERSKMRLEINHLFPLLPSVESFHCFSDVELNYEVFLTCYPRLKELTLPCRKGHTNSSTQKMCNFISKLKELKSLTVPTCILKDLSAIKHKTLGYRRRSLRKYKLDIPFTEILKSCTDLQRLEICQLTARQDNGIGIYNPYWQHFALQGSKPFGRMCSPIPLRCNGLEHIANLHKLQHLQLCNIPLYQDNLLITIAQGCPLLVSLKLKHIGQRNTTCSYVEDLCVTIKMLKSLEDFSWEQDFIFPCHEIFQTLMSHSPNLRRIYMKNVFDNHEVHPTALLDFIEHAPYLRFAFFVFEISKHLVEDLKRSFKLRAPPHLIWAIHTPDGSSERMETPIPTIFNGEMCLFRPWVLNRLMHLH